MLTELAVPYADTSAAALQWSPGPPLTASLDELALTAGGARLVLHLLGASHAASLTAAGAGLAETVACPGHGAAGEPLPAFRERVVGPLRYRFTSRVEHLAAGDLAALAARLRDDARGPGAPGPGSGRLVGVFPGDGDALTALEGCTGPGSARWRTWHLYPAAGQAVRTTSQVRW